MKRTMGRLSIAACAAVASMLATATPAFAINTTGCGSRTDFLKVWYNGGANTVCYANDGGIPVSYQRVTQISTGNNTAQVEIYLNGSGGYQNLAHNHTYLYNLPGWSLYYITITGR